MTRLANGNEMVTPSAGDTALVKESSGRLAAHLERGGEFRLEVRADSGTEELVLPPSVLRILVRILDEIGSGNAVTLTPVTAELTTQQAADLLNVSRPHLVKLLDEGAIPSWKVGTHRRVRLEDVLAHKQEHLDRRHTALDELQALSQELDMGY